MDTQQVINIIYLFGNAFRIYVIYQFVKVFFEADASGKRKVIRVAMYSMFFALNSASFLWFSWSPTVIMLSNFAAVFAITLTYRGKVLYRLIATAMVAGFTVLCEDLVYFSLLAINVRHIVIIGIALSVLLFYMLVMLFQKLSDIKHGQDIIPAQWISIVLVPICTMIISVTALADCNNDTAVAIGEILLLLLNVLIFYLFDSISKTYQKKNYLQALEAQSTAYKKQLNVLKQSEEKVAMMRHDMKNHISNLLYLSQKCDADEVIEYLGGINSRLESEERFVATGDHLFDGLLNLKLGEAVLKLDAKVEYDIAIPEMGAEQRMDTSIVIGNLLDNSLQALEQCYDNRILNVSVSTDKGVLMIGIENTYNGNLKTKDGQIITTKNDKENHGLGIKNVKHIVQKYNGNVNINHTGSLFKVTVMMYVNN